ncbi:adhesion G-protein coupled receptor F1 isoform X3 [Ornithorhynchus anatinus]|uniref:Adhesion G protein-coupled receptor F1 n=2 Tax=Ornithorhynchus anatinus TaxID=9258 RepID=A0A6I8P099_ORNAN|nr:adhesion G-protein coupled receptor F1 isoform X3 [Ornithorhynchus anatinus]
MKMRFQGIFFMVSFVIMVLESESLLTRKKTRMNSILDWESHFDKRFLAFGSNREQEYELLLQVTYQNAVEKGTLKDYLNDLKPLWLNETLKITGAKATTSCTNVSGTLKCGCEDGYSWFSQSCLEPQKCHLNMTGNPQLCRCHHSHLNESRTFCERTTIFGSFKMKRNFTNDLLNSSSAEFCSYATGIEIQLKEAYRGIRGFDSVHVTQFREGSIVAGFEIIGSSSTSELLPALQKVAGKALRALKEHYPIEDSSFQVKGKAECNDHVFGFGFENDQYTVPCGDGYVGNITAKCQSSKWKIEKETCVLSQMDELKKNITALQGQLRENSLSTIIRTLSTMTGNTTTTAGNLGSVVEILGTISSLSLSNQVKVSRSTMEDIIMIANHILNSASLSNWTVLLKEENNASSQLLETLENMSSLVPSSALPLNISKKFFNWIGIPGNENLQHDGFSYHATFSQDNNSLPIHGGLSIGKSQFQNAVPETLISMASLTLGTLLPDNFHNATEVNGLLISAVIQNYSINEIFLNFSKINSTLSRPQCVFWGFNDLEWNMTGCQLMNETEETVTCRCAHLTSFSVLMSPSVPHAFNPVVEWITYIGLGISIVSLVLALITEAVFWQEAKKNRTSYTRHICLVNIALSLLMADIWFIIGTSTKGPENHLGICTAVTFFTHFFYLSLFFWMLTLGILMAYRILLVFHHMAMPIMMVIGLSLGYGCPVIISIVTIVITLPNGAYIRKDTCWLNWAEEAKPLLAFAIPALTIVTLNLITVSVVLIRLRRPAVGEGLTRDDKTTLIRIGKSVLILTPLLGLTWGFGIGTMVDGQSLAWHVIFSLLNAFQGFFVFCFGVLFDKKVRRVLGNRLSLLRSFLQQMKNASYEPATLKFPKPFNLFRKGAYTVSGTGEATSSFTLNMISSSEDWQVRLVDTRNCKSLRSYPRQL